MAQNVFESSPISISSTTRTFDSHTFFLMSATCASLGGADGFESVGRQGVVFSIFEGLTGLFRFRFAEALRNVRAQIFFVEGVYNDEGYIC
jgi:hypothetical protein